MRETIISDASCFIILSNIGELELLHKTYGTIVTTSVIVHEFGEPLPDWVVIKDPRSPIPDQSLSKLGNGEVSAIQLALELPDSLIILDDNDARRAAIKLGLAVTGTLGVFVRAKAKGIIPRVKPLIDKMRTTNFRISASIELETLQLADEL